KRIHYEFYKNLKIDSLNGKLEQNPISFSSQGKINSTKNIRLKSFVNDSHYYLLGSTGNEKQTQKFFHSFELEKFNYLKEPSVVKDTVLNFQVNAPYKPMKDYRDYESFQYQDNSKKNHFVGANKTKSYYSDSQQKIKVNFREFDRYES